jgi:hypothetical protein
METIFALFGASFLTIATIGFLLIQQFLENRIRNKNSSSIDLSSSQKETVEWLEKANSYREQATLIHHNIIMMKRLGVERSIIDEPHKAYLHCLKISAMNTINALGASKKIDNEKSEELQEKLHNLSEGELKKAYADYAKEAAEATFDLGSTARDHKKDILRLEKAKQVWWCICFTFQLLGLTCGLLSIASKTCT